MEIRRQFHFCFRSAIYARNIGILPELDTYGQVWGKEFEKALAIHKAGPVGRIDIRNTGRFRDGVNVSVQNATARNNQMTAILKIKDGKYSYAPTNFVIPVLPSINYYCTF